MRGVAVPRPGCDEAREQRKRGPEAPPGPRSGRRSIVTRVRTPALGCRDRVTEPSSARDLHRHARGRATRLPCPRGRRLVERRLSNRLPRPGRRTAPLHSVARRPSTPSALGRHSPQTQLDHREQGNPSAFAPAARRHRRGRGGPGRGTAVQPRARRPHHRRLRAGRYGARRTARQPSRRHPARPHAARVSTGSRSRARSSATSRPRAYRSSSSPPRARRSIGSSASSWAPTTTSPSRSARARWCSG